MLTLSCFTKRKIHCHNEFKILSYGLVSKYCDTVQFLKFNKHHQTKIWNLPQEKHKHHMKHDQ